MKMFVLEHFEDFSSFSLLALLPLALVGTVQSRPSSLFMPQTVVVALVSTLPLHLMLILISRFVFSICLLYDVIYI